MNKKVYYRIETNGMKKIYIVWKLAYCYRLPWATANAFYALRWWFFFSSIRWMALESEKWYTHAYRKPIEQKFSTKNPCEVYTMHIYICIYQYIEDIYERSCPLLKLRLFRVILLAHDTYQISNKLRLNGCMKCRCFEMFRFSGCRID